MHGGPEADPISLLSKQQLMRHYRAPFQNLPTSQDLT
jgi:hypothetical protein